MYKLLKLLEENPRFSNEELGTMLDMTGEEVAAAIKEYEEQRIIQGYRSIVDWERTDRPYITAHIELKVAPKKDRGFEELAEVIAGFEEVDSLYLMSGGYDLSLIVVGKDFREIASFVAYRLAPLDSVQSTATHFILRHYKEKGITLMDSVKEERRQMF